MSENLHIAVTGDNKGFIDALNEARDGVRRTANAVEQSGMGIEDMFKRIAAAAGIAFSLDQAKSFISKVAEVRGEFQQLEIALNTMLGSASKADALMSQLIRTAATTPFGMSDVANGAKQLLAYGVQAEEVNETLVRLGDIAAGLSIPLNDLAYLYGTTMVQGRMYTQDLNQFLGRGIPLTEQLAAQFGVAKDKVKDLVTEGKVGFEEVKKAVWSLTDEGGKFGGLMAAQSKSITGQISNIEDAIEQMFNEIGKSSEGAIGTALEGVSLLVENYEKVGEAIMVAATAYGSYKAVLMAVTAVQTLNTAVLREAALQKALAASAGITLSNAEAVAAARTQLLALAQRGLAAAIKSVTASLLTNPYVLAAAAITGLVYVIYKMATADSAAESAKKALNNRLEELTETQRKYCEETQNAIKLAEDDAAATTDRDEALQLLIGRYPQIVQKYIDEKGHLRDVLALKKEIAEFDGMKQRQEATETLRRTGQRAWRNYNDARTVIDALFRAGSDNPLPKEDRELLERLREQYKNDTGTSWWGMLGVDIANIRDFYKNLAETSRKRYARNLTVNRISDFTKEGGAMEGYTDEQLKTLRDTLRNTLAKKYTTDGSGNGKNTAVYIQELGDYLDNGDRRSLLTRVEGMVEARGKAKGTAAEWAAAAGKKYRDALKAYNDFIGDTSGSLTQDAFETKAKKLKDAVDAAKKEYDKVKPGTDSDMEKSRKASEKAAREEERRQQASEKLGHELAGLQRENDAAEIAAMDEGLQKKLRQIDNDYQARKNEIDKQEADWKRENMKAGAGGGLSAEQQSAIDEARALNDTRLQRATADAYREELSVMRDYLKEYGSIEQQRLAIAQEYEEKIAKATSPSQRAALTLQQSKELENFDQKQLEEDVDWAGVFSDLQSHTKEYLEGLRTQLQGLLDEGKLPADQMSVVQEKIRDINAEISKQNGLFQFVGDKAREHNRLLQASADAQAELNKAKQEEAEARQGVEQATEAVRSLMESLGVGRDTAIEDGLLNGMDASSEEYRRMQELLTKLRVGEGELAQARKNTATATKKAKNAEDASKRDAPQAVADWFADAQQFISEKGIDRIPDLLGEMGLGEAGKKVEQGLGGLKNAASAAEDFAGGNYIGAALHGVSAIKDFGSALGIGGGNEAKVAETTERLTEANELLADRISDLAEVIGDSAGQKAIGAYEAALEAQKELQENNMELLRAQMGYHSAHRSNAYYASDAKIRKLYDQSRSTLGKAGYDLGDIAGLGDIYGLTPEELKAIKDFAPDLWKYLTEVGKYDKSEYWEKVVEQAGKTEELTEKINDNLTQTSFDSLRDSFLDALTDMESSSEDFAQTFENMMFKAVLNSIVLNDEFDDWLQDWQRRYALAVKDNDTEKLERLRQEAVDMRDAKVEERDRYAGLMDYGSQYSQEASAKGFQAMSQDTGEELNGRFTALQISGDAIARQAEQMYGQMVAMTAIQTSANNTLAEIRNLMVYSNSYLEDVARYSKKMYLEFGEKLDSMIHNTRSL